MSMILICERGTYNGHQYGSPKKIVSKISVAIGFEQNRGITSLSRPVNSYENYLNKQTL